MGSASFYNVLILLIFIVMLSGCDTSKLNEIDTKYFNNSKNYSNISETTKVLENPIDFDRKLTELGTEDVDDSMILIGSWDLGSFTEGKADNSYIYPVVKNIIDDYDLIFLQGIKTQINIEGFTNTKLRDDGYMFLFSDKIKKGYSEEYPDNNNIYTRKPFISSFIQDNYEFVIIGLKVKSDNAVEEIKELDNVINWTRQEFSTNNIFVMGDLMSDIPYFDENDKILENYNWLIDNDQDTVVSRQKLTYDRIIAVSDNERLFGFGVDELEEETEGDKELLEHLSKNFPVFITLK